MALSPLAPPTCSDDPIWNAWMSAFLAPALAVADDLGLFAALDAEPASAAELAARLGIELRATEALTGVLAALGLLELRAGQLHLTEPGRTYLVPGRPYYWGPMLRRIRDIPIDCKRLLESLRRGTATAEARVTSMWQTAPPQAIVAFTHAMHAHSFSLAMRTVPALGLAAGQRLLDVGGGSGSYSIAAMLHQPALRCVVLDLPAVCGVAREYAEAFGVAERLELAPGDMFADPWPEGCDRIFLSDIFHDWDAERCRQLAARAYDALPPGGGIIVHEMILADTLDGPLGAAAYSMVMLFVAQGRQRSARELGEILTSAGFSAVTETPTAGGYALVTGTKT